MITWKSYHFGKWVIQKFITSNTLISKIDHFGKWSISNQRSNSLPRNKSLQKWIISKNDHLRKWAIQKFISSNRVTSKQITSKMNLFEKLPLRQMGHFEIDLYDIFCSEIDHVGKQVISKMISSKINIFGMSQLAKESLRNRCLKIRKSNLFTNGFQGVSF